MADSDPLLDEIASLLKAGSQSTVSLLSPPDCVRLIERLDQAIEKYPNESLLWHWRGWTFQFLKDRQHPFQRPPHFEIVEDCYERALELDPKNGASAVMLARHYWEYARAGALQNLLHAHEDAESRTLAIGSAILDLNLPGVTNQLSSYAKQYLDADSISLVRDAELAIRTHLNFGESFAQQTFGYSSTVDTKRYLAFYSSYRHWFHQLEDLVLSLLPSEAGSVWMDIGAQWWEFEDSTVDSHIELFRRALELGLPDQERVNECKMWLVCLFTEANQQDTSVAIQLLDEVLSWAEGLEGEQRSAYLPLRGFTKFFFRFLDESRERRRDTQTLALIERAIRAGLINSDGGDYDDWLLYYAGSLCFQTGDYAKACEYLLTAYSLIWPIPDDFMGKLIASHMKVGRYDRAFEICSGYLEYEPPGMEQDPTNVLVTSVHIVLKQLRETKEQQSQLTPTSVDQQNTSVARQNENALIAQVLSIVSSTNERVTSLDASVQSLASAISGLQRDFDRSTDREAFFERISSYIGSHINWVPTLLQASKSELTHAPAWFVTLVLESEWLYDFYKTTRAKNYAVCAGHAGKLVENGLKQALLQPYHQWLAATKHTGKKVPLDRPIELLKAAAGDNAHSLRMYFQTLLNPPQGEYWFDNHLHDALDDCRLLRNRALHESNPIALSELEPVRTLFWERQLISQLCHLFRVASST